MDGIYIQFWLCLSLGSMFSQAMKKWVQGNTDEVSSTLVKRSLFRMASCLSKVSSFLFLYFPPLSSMAHRCSFIQGITRKGGLFLASNSCLVKAVEVSSVQRLWPLKNSHAFKFPSTSSHRYSF